jgi:hypothetical protein
MKTVPGGYENKYQSKNCALKISKTVFYEHLAV